MLFGLIVMKMDEVGSRKEMDEDCRGEVKISVIVSWVRDGREN